MTELAELHSWTQKLKSHCAAIAHCSSKQYLSDKLLGHLQPLLTKQYQHSRHFSGQPQADLFLADPTKDPYQKVSNPLSHKPPPLSPKLFQCQCWDMPRGCSITIPSCQKNPSAAPSRPLCGTTTAQRYYQGSAYSTIKYILNQNEISTSKQHSQVSSTAAPCSNTNQLRCTALEGALLQLASPASLGNAL